MGKFKKNKVQNRNSPGIKKSADFNVLSKNKKRKETRYPDDKNSSFNEGAGFIPLKKHNANGVKKNVKPIFPSKAKTFSWTGNKLSSEKKKKVVSKIPDDFVEEEASEGEEPIEMKDMKPFQKQIKKKLGYRHISDEDGDSVTDLLDLEASEGEETDQDDSDAEFSDDFINFQDGSSDEANDANDNFAQSSNEENESNDENESDEENKSDEENESNSDGENKVNIKSNAKALKKSKNDVTKVKKQPAIIQSKVNETEKNTESSKIGSKRKLNEDALKLDNIPSKKAKTKKFVPLSSFVGFIRKVPQGVTVPQLKEPLAEKVDSTKILEVILKFRKKRNSGFGNAFVYLADKEALETLTSYEFTIGDTSLVVHEARESQKRAEKKEPVAFIPRIPSSIPDETIKNVLEKDAGVGKVVKFKAKAISDKKGVRNLLVYFSDEESLSAVVSQGHYQIDGRPILVREATESGAKLQLHRVVLSSIPQGTTEADIKTAVESVTGEDTVKNVKFSFQKKSFAFVTLTEQDYVNKALSAEIEINSRKLKVDAYRPRKPKPAKNKNRENKQNQPPANITKKQEAGNLVENQENSKGGFKKQNGLINNGKPVENQQTSKGGFKKAGGFAKTGKPFQNQQNSKGDFKKPGGFPKTGKPVQNEQNSKGGFKKAGGFPKTGKPVQNEQNSKGGFKKPFEKTEGFVKTEGGYMKRFRKFTNAKKEKKVKVQSEDS